MAKRITRHDLGWVYKRRPHIAAKLEGQIKVNMGIGYLSGVQGVDQYGDIPLHMVSFLRAQVLKIMLRRIISIGELSEASDIDYERFSRWLNDGGELTTGEFERVCWALEVSILIVDKDTFDFKDFDAERLRILQYRKYMRDKKSGLAQDKEISEIDDVSEDADSDE